ncbi:DZIP3 ligase, partial [Cisticola juncidis]|nr:DZIP3 ligase [Cisticola juncidis]
NSQQKLQEIRQEFTRFQDQSILLWLHLCWCLGANTWVFLNSHEAKQLGSLSRDVAIDRGIGRRTGTVSLWLRLVSSVRQAYTADQLLAHQGRWHDPLEGVLYLTELAMADVLFGNAPNNRYLHNPMGAYCTWPMWQKFIKSTPPPYAKAVVSIRWRKNLKVQQLQDYVMDLKLTPSSPPQDSFSHVEIQPKECAASSDDPCAICHEELGRSPCELECGHEFHRECIRTWLQEHCSTCPICRDHAVLPADVPAWNNSKLYRAKHWKRSMF